MPTSSGLRSGPNSRLAANLAEGGATYYFAVPLGDRTVGVLQSVCTRPCGFTNEQIQLLYVVADLLGPAVSNCRLFSDLSAASEAPPHAKPSRAHGKDAHLGELAAGMAHDFNNSLCAVLGFLELTLLDSALPANCRGYSSRAVPVHRCGPNRSACARFCPLATQRKDRRGRGPERVGSSNS